MNFAKRRSLISDLMVCFIGLMVIVVICISGIFYNQLVNQNKKQTLDKFEQSFFQAHTALEESLSGMITTATTLSTNNDLAVMVKEGHTLSGDQPMEVRSAVRSTIVNAVNLNSNLADVAIYGQDTLYRYNESRFNEVYKKRLPQEPWFTDLRNGKIHQVIIPEYEVSEDLELCIFACTFLSMSRTSSQDVIVVTLDNKTLHKIVDDVDRSYLTTVCLLGQSGDLLYSNHPDTAGQLVADGFELSELRNGQEYHIAGQKYYIVKSTSAHTGWDLIAFTKASDLNQAFYSVPLSLLIGCLLAVAACVLLSMWFFRAISRPLREIVTAIDQTIPHNFEKVAIDSPHKEIQTIATAFNHLNGNIVHYIDEIQRAEKEKHVTELKLLEAQINPHFIYNTLDSVRWMAVINNDPVVAEMVSSFSSLLRISLSSGKEQITVAQELEHVRQYINIMQIRYNSEVSVSFEAAPQVCEFYTLKFIIQPFVENCFLHAFESGEMQQKQVLVKAHILEGSTLAIEISDNGKGIDAAADLYKNRMRSGIGIKNINERIQLYYGPQYGIDISSARGRGTTVRIQQPLVRSQEEKS